jgi:uncharacterized protein (DUF488 family)
MLNTIGYENSEISDFIASVSEAGVDILVDVRDRAQSRKKGFSKTALSEALGEVGIEYLHLRELGDPKEGRDAARSGQWTKFLKIYGKVLASDVAQDAMDLIVELSNDKSVCLLCYERDHKTCHRKCITDEIENRAGKKARHLGVRKFERAA